MDPSDWGAWPFGWAQVWAAVPMNMLGGPDLDSWFQLTLGHQTPFTTTRSFSEFSPISNITKLLIFTISSGGGARKGHEHWLQWPPPSSTPSPYTFPSPFHHIIHWKSPSIIFIHSFTSPAVAAPNFIMQHCQPWTTLGWSKDTSGISTSVPIHQYRHHSVLQVFSSAHGQNIQ